MDDTHNNLVFAVLNEIGIIEQLSRTLLEARLPTGLIAPHFTVLNHLVRVGDGHTPMRIAKAFQVPKTSLTHTLSVLEKRGLIEMQPNPRDGRSKCVWITPAGRHLREETIAGMAPDAQWVLDRMDADELAAILPALTRLRALLDLHRSGKPEN